MSTGIRVVSAIAGGLLAVTVAAIGLSVIYSPLADGGSAHIMLLEEDDAYYRLAKRDSWLADIGRAIVRDPVRMRYAPVSGYEAYTSDSLARAVEQELMRRGREICDEAAPDCGPDCRGVLGGAPLSDGSGSAMYRYCAPVETCAQVTSVYESLGVTIWCEAYE